MKNAPSIETFLSRTQGERAYPIARQLHDLPVVGTMARAWVRSTRTGAHQSLWASLPPVAA